VKRAAADECFREAAELSEQLAELVEDTRLGQRAVRPAGDESRERAA
jgi:hypothetical protein